jgi:hypothetical protein
VKIKTLIIVVGLVAVAFSGLRVYGAYRTERTDAANPSHRSQGVASVDWSN